MWTRLLICLVVVLLGVASGCGDDEGPERDVADPAPEAEVTPGGGDAVTLTGIEGRLEAAGLMLQRTGLGSAIEEEIDQPLLEAAREEIEGRAEFELLIFGNARSARAAMDELQETELVSRGGEVVSGANVAAVFPEAIGSRDGYRVVADVVRGLR